MSVAVPPEYVRSEKTIEKIVRSKFFWIIFIVVGFTYPVYKSLNRILPPELPIITRVPDFQLISENGQRFGSENLKGRVYLANFIFSRCPSICPKMLGELEKVQKGSAVQEQRLRSLHSQ